MQSPNNYKLENFYDYQQGYENSHSQRFDFLVSDLKLNELKGHKIADYGCGSDFLYKRLSPDIQVNYNGYDSADLSLPFNYTKVDLNNFETDKVDFFDTSLCFETMEHLANPYNCLLQIKKSLKKDHILYLSIPHERTLHNTIYPGLLYPVENFVVFLKQLAFEVLDQRYHNKNFHQNVFILKNKDWHHSNMVWYKKESKFRNVPPHVAINL